MKPPSSPSPDPIVEAAAVWAVRHDRGLTAAEQDDLSQWLAASEAHRAAWAETRWGWDELDRLAGLQTSVHALPDPDLLLPRRRFRPVAVILKFGLPVLAAAAAVTLGFFLIVPRLTVPADATVAPHTLALIEQRVLPDGSTVELNRGAVLTEQFTAGERRVRLEQGEAHFQVARDAARPFVVEASGVAVRAVGTAFNVRIEPTAVEVLVTEGRVRVDDAVRGQSLLGAMVNGESPVLSAGQTARVDLAPTAVPQVAAISAAELEQRLAWKPRLLDFTNTAMPEIVAAFNRSNPVQLTLGDTLLADMRLSATFRSDNVEGFVRLMESDFGLRAEWRSDGEIILSRTR
jgi:transmembrane sensor